MTRFAAILDSAGPEAAWPAVQGVETDLSRRYGRAHRTMAGRAILSQSGHDAPCRLGPLTLAGDLGLTDLTDLARALSAPPDSAPATLVLMAWSRWGVGALDRLHGAFAFALHDARDGRTTVVRDRFGMRPVIWARQPGRIVVGQDIATVVSGLDIAPGPDPRWIADFLTGRPTLADATALAGVSRLPAGTLLIISGDGQTQLSGWYRLQDRPDPLTTHGPDTRAEALRAALAHATAQALDTAPSATMLSGGLDSSTLSLLSVADGAAPPVPRPTLSLRYADAALDEGRFIDAVLDKAGGRLAPLSLPGDATATLFDLDPLLAEQGEPVFAPGLAGNRMMYRAVRDAGCGAVIDGHGGDEVIGGAFMDLGWLIDRGQWGRALRLASRYARFTDSSPRESIGMLLAWKGRRGFGRLGRWLAPPPSDGRDWRRLVDPALADRVGLVDRVNALTQDQGRERTDLPPWVAAHARLLSSPRIAAGFEPLDRAARAVGVVPLYPFYDHRVVELCVWQPGPDRVGEGQPRALLRRAMRGVLPESVRLRGDKINFLPDFWGQLRADPAGRLAALRRDPAALAGLVNLSVLRADLDRLAAGGNPDAPSAFRLWRCIWLAAWLSRRAADPALSLAGPR